MDYTASGWLTAIFLCGVVALVIYLHHKWKLSVVRGYGLKGPKPLPFIGNMHQILAEGIMTAEKKWIQEYGQVFGFYFGSQHNITVLDQEILKHVLVKDFSHFSNRSLLDTTPSPLDKGIFFLRSGDWKRARSIMNPTFSSSKLRMMSNDINICAKNLAMNLQKHADKEESVVIKNFYGAFTIDVISMTAFGLDVDSQSNPNDPLISHLSKIFNTKGFPVAVLLAALFGGWMIKLLKWLKVCFYPRDSLEFFDREVRMMIEDRKKNPRNRTDFLQLLINAEMEETPDNEAKEERKCLSTDEIIGQSFLFFLAGYETTASLLSFNAYQLACHPEVQDKIYLEITEQLGDEQPNYDNVVKLKYMEQAFFETLRMFPALGRVNREASKTMVLNGVTIPKGSAVIIPIRAIHYDPDLYPDPNEFKPERFADFKPNHNQINFLPFGHGPRTCIGMRLALVEAKIALTYVLRKVRFFKSAETEVPLSINDSGLTQPKTPIKLKVAHR